MPLKKWSSQKTISSNIKELMTTKPWTARSKWIKIISNKMDIPLKKAKQIQSVAIAYSKAKKTK